MYKNQPKEAERIAEELINIEKYPSHGQVINYRDGLKIGLRITYKSFDDPIWQMLWHLYISYIVVMKEQTTIKIFENRNSSVMI
jgi:hypothetical protein